MKNHQGLCPSKTTVLGLIALSLFVSCLPTAHAATCSLATVAGSYAVATLGQEAGAYGVALFRLTSDGAGNLSGAGGENINGNSYPNVTAAGTYTVTADCSFTSTINDSLGNIRNITGAIFENGAEIAGISTDAGTVLQFTAYRQKLTSCTTASAAGHFVTELQSPETPYGSSVGSNQFTVNKQGKGTGSWVANFGGVVFSGTATTVLSVNSDCTFTSTTKNSNGTTGHSFGVGGILNNGVATLFIGTDSGWVSLATAYDK